MLQIKVFPIGSDGEAAFNNFVHVHHVVQNGVSVKENVIVALYDDSFFGKEEQILLLKINAAELKKKILESSLEKSYIDSLVSAKQGGDDMLSTQHAKGKEVQALHKKLYILEEYIKDIERGAAQPNDNDQSNPAQ